MGCQAKRKLRHRVNEAFRVAGISILITAIIEFVLAKDASFGEVLLVGSYLNPNPPR